MNFVPIHTFIEGSNIADDKKIIYIPTLKKT